MLQEFENFFLSLQHLLDTRLILLHPGRNKIQINSDYALISNLPCFQGIFWADLKVSSSDKKQNKDWFDEPLFGMQVKPKTIS